MNLPFLPRQPYIPLRPYNEGYLAATRAKTEQLDGGIVRMPHKVYRDGSWAQVAFIEGISDSIRDREPRRPYHRVSRAHPPWRLI